MKGGTIDYENVLGTNQGPITADAVTSDLRNFGVADPDIGAAGRGVMRFVVTTAAGGDGSVKFKIQDCDTEGGSYEDIAATRDYEASELVKGKIMELPFPTENRQFVQGAFDVTGTVTGLTVSTNIDPE